MQSTYKEKALPMISVDQNTGKYTFEDEASNFIKSVPGPIGVISVAGLYRTGKSYLLNRMLLNRSNGFGVGPTVNPCTKGLWVWGTPLKGLTNQGQTINIIVVDTEGIGALDEDQTHDTRIFTLAILASSCFIYNSVGSIDETAVQNLSLVVNLTKHIHLKSQSKSEEDTDPDEFASFFPSFYWVVRDFALKLEDQGGDAINSKEYLEKALALQKGFTDDVEEKNRIRRLLTTFFRERECFTLIRPCIEEQKLRTLDKLNFDELRPQFVEQVMTFRKRVINRMKPKIVNSKKLNGEMYFSLMRNYVNAINDGAVPNIENAWNYMCKQQCYKISAEAFDLFEARFKEGLSQKIPCADDDFKNAARSAKEQAYELFRKKSFGDNIEQFLKELKKKIKAKITYVKTQNEKQSMSTAHQFVVRNFTAIEKKLKLQEFKSYSEFEKQMAGLYAHVLENGPKLPNSKLVYLEFMRKVLPQGADFFFRASDNEFEKLKSLASQREKNYDREVKDLREQLSKQRKSGTQKVTSLDREKVQLTMKVEKLTEDLQKLIKEREQETTKLGKSLESRQSQLETLRRTLQQKVNQLNEKNEQLNTRLVTGEKEWEKQRAIFELKVKQFSSQCEDLQKKEKIFDSTINASKSDFNFQIKENSLKYEKKISELTMELNEFREKTTELTEELTTLKEQFESNKDKFDKKERKYKEDLSNKTKQLEKMKHESQLERNRLENECQIAKEQVTKEFRDMADNYKRQEASVKTMTDQLKAQKSAADKEIAILTQKLGFLQESLRESKQQLAEVKQNHEATIAAMEEANGRLAEQSLNERIIQLKNSHLTEVKNIETEFENTRKKLQFELETISKAKSDLELRVSLLENTVVKEKEQRELAQKRADEKIESLTNENSQLQRNKTGRLKEQEVFYENKIKELERELEEAMDKASNEQRESHSKSEEAITQLKNYYELEKEKLESKLTLEREKFEKKYKKMVDEYEQKHKNEITALEDENEQIKQEYMNLQSTMQNTVNQLQHENDLKSKQLQNLERSLFELKQSTSKRQSQLNVKYQTLSQTTRTEKQIQYQKIELLQTENNKKEKSIMTLTHLKDQLTTTLEKKQAENEDIRREATDLKVNFEKTTEELKRKYQELSTQYLEKKIGYEKTIALSSQESEFYSKKVKELEKQVEGITQTYEERLRIAKEETSGELKVYIEKYQQERTLLEQKYEKLKKTTRENQANLQKQLSEMDKERAINQQKFANLQQKLKETETKRASEIEGLNAQVATFKESISTDRKSYQTEVEKLKNQFETIDNEKSEIVSNYEKDRILWENKNNFLEQQREQSKAQTSQKIRKLQTTIDILQRNRQNQKSSSQSQHNEYVSKIQKKYLAQISQLNETNTKKTMQFESTVRELQLQLKNAKENYMLDLHSKTGNAAATEKRLAELIESEKKMQAELERLRSEKDQRTFEFQKQLEQEKENMRGRVRDMEDQLKSMEREKREKYFEYEREMSKWKFEEANRTDKIQTLQEQITKFTEEAEKLQRQNERLRTQRKNSKVVGMQSFLASKWNNYNPDKMNKSNLAASPEFTILPHDDEDKENNGQKQMSSFRSQLERNF